MQILDYVLNANRIQHSAALYYLPALIHSQLSTIRCGGGSHCFTVPILLGSFGCRVLASARLSSSARNVSMSTSSDMSVKFTECA